jgi:hypothetical protein
MPKPSKPPYLTRAYLKESIRAGMTFADSFYKKQRAAYVFKAAYEVAGDGSVLPMADMEEIGVNHRDLSQDAIALADSVAAFRAVALKESDGKNDACSVSIEIHISNGLTRTTVSYSTGSWTADRESDLLG